MNYSSLLRDIQAHMVTNDAIVKVYREQFVPPEADKTRGYLAFDFTLTDVQKCNLAHTGIIEGDLDIISYATSDVRRSILTTSAMDLWIPRVGTTRVQIAPTVLGTSFLHFIYLESMLELHQEKTGHPIPETIGTLMTFHLKASIVETGVE
jgi:hypothetical protein